MSFRVHSWSCLRKKSLKILNENIRMKFQRPINKADIVEVVVADLLTRITQEKRSNEEYRNKALVVATKA
ncbi:hypothetical protein J6590_032072 [Homalodisca vitripennis]|nr:hypothetical protein J6590_032072 [Homalodisca vitripennis]